MQIDVKGRNVPVTDEQRERVRRRCMKIERQVSPLARLEVEFWDERNPAVPEPHVVDLTLYLKGVTLRARQRAREPLQAINLAGDELARQVKRHRDKRRARRARAHIAVEPH
jgi:putative sigma-54 modulation protein